MGLTANGYTMVSAGTTSYLNAAYTKLNQTTNSLMASMEIYRLDPSSLGGPIDSRVTADVASINDAIETGIETIGKNQAADAAMADIYDNLSQMRGLAYEASLGTLSEGQVAANDAAYQTLAEQITALLAETAYQAEPVLSGDDAVVTLSLDNVTSMSLTALPQGASADIGKAMTDVGLARNTLSVETTRVSSAVEGLQAQTTKLADLSAQATTAEEALGVLSSTTQLIMTQLHNAMQAQSNNLSSQAQSLVGVDFLG